MYSWLSGYATLDLLTNIDLFAMGAIPAYLLTTQGERVAAWVDSVLGLAQTLLRRAWSSESYWWRRTFRRLVKVLGPSVLGLLFGGLLTLFLSTRSRFGISDRNILSRLGKYTYGLYLYHVIVLSF